jgi:hypothetical protein
MGLPRVSDRAHQHVEFCALRFGGFARTRTTEGQDAPPAEHDAPFTRFGPADELRSEVVSIHGAARLQLLRPIFAFLLSERRRLRQPRRTRASRDLERIERTR